MDQVLPMLLAEGQFYSANDLPDDLLGEVVDTFKETKLLEEAFHPIFQELSNRMRNFTILDPYNGTLNAMVKLTKHAPLAKALTTHPNWISKVKNGLSMESSSILGPFFCLSTYINMTRPGRQVSEQLFGGAGSRLTPEEVGRTAISMRNLFKTIYDTVHKIMRNLLIPKETREATVEWLAVAIEGNKTRSRIQDDPFQSSSDAFLTNLCAVLLRLSEPVLKKERESLTLSPDFPMSNTLVNFKEDSKIGSVSEKEGLFLLVLHTNTLRLFHCKHSH